MRLNSGARQSSIISRSNSCEGGSGDLPDWGILMEELQVISLLGHLADDLKSTRETFDIYFFYLSKTLRIKKLVYPVPMILESDNSAMDALLSGFKA